MKLALAFILGTCCGVFIAGMRASSWSRADEKRIRFEMWRDLERVDSV